MYTWQRSEVRTKFFPENLMERNLLEDFGKDGQDVNLGTGVMWFKVGLCEHCNQY
jgi:hypothetical protein